MLTYSTAVALLATLVWIPASSPALAQQLDCSNCILGVYDDPAMNATAGRIDRYVPKTLYLGLRLEPGRIDVASILFDILYPEGFTILGAVSYIPDADIVQVSASGVQVTWPRCIAGSQLLFSIEIVTLRRVRDAVMQLQNVQLRPCVDPAAAPRAIAGGCYVFNPSGALTACSMASQPSTWGGVKGLFKSPGKR